MIAQEQILPHSIPAEQAVLGSILIDGDMFAQIASILKPDDFYRDAHRTIYSTMANLYEQKVSLDFITICDELAHQGKLSDVGGASYITSLINNIPTSGNAPYYARIVQRTSIQRGIVNFAGQAATIGYSNEDAPLEEVQRLLMTLVRTGTTETITHIASNVDRCLQDIDELSRGNQEPYGVTTGYPELTRMLKGFKKTRLIVLAARTGIGKTALSLNMAVHAAREGKTVVMFSCEMSKEELTLRLMSLVSKVPHTRLESGDIHGDDEWENIIHAHKVLSSIPIYMDERGTLSVMDIRTSLQAFMVDHPVDLVIVDYLQLLQASKPGMNNEQRVSEIAWNLKMLAMDLDVPVLALAQLSRKVEDRADKHPMLSDLRESGAIEQTANQVLFLYREDEYDPETQRKNIVDVLIRKNRGGPQGDVSLYWKGDTMSFYNLEDER